MGKQPAGVRPGSPAASRPAWSRWGCELQRDRARQETAEGFTQILFGGERPLAGASTEPAGDGARAGR